jgi:hypothetical protein
MEHLKLPRKNKHHARLEDTSLNAANGHSSDTTDLVDVLKGKTQRLVTGAFRGCQGIEALDQDGPLVPI